MGLEDIIAKIASHISVKAVFLLEGEFYGEVVEEESSITESSMGMPLVNRALEEVLKRGTALCIFCDGGFEHPMDHIMVMEDGAGNRVGHDVPACMINDFKDDQDIFWLCDDFAIYPNKAETHDMLIIMLPQKVKYIGESEGAKNPVLLYPATTTDIMLRKHFGISVDDPGMASAILAFDII